MPATDLELCRYPGCERPATPPPATGGRSYYCADPAHNARTAHSARQRARGTSDEEGVASAGQRPASMAIASFREAVLRMESLVGEFSALSDKALSALSAARDADVIEAQLAAVQADAARMVADAQGQVADEQRRRIAAEEDARNAIEAADHMSAEVEAAESTAADALERARRAERSVEQAEARAAHAKRTAVALRAEVEAGMRTRAELEQRLEAALQLRDQALETAEAQRRRAEEAVSAREALERALRPSREPQAPERRPASAKQRATASPGKKV